MRCLLMELMETRLRELEHATMQTTFLSDSLKLVGMGCEKLMDYNEVVKGQAR